MFQPNVAIIRFSSESMVVVLYRFGMGMSGWWDLSICDVCYMLFLRGTVWGGICDVRYPGVCSSSMSAHCCSMWVSCYCLSIYDVYWWCAFVMGCVSILCISGDLCVQSVLCVRLLVFHLGGVVFDGLVTGSQTCLVIVTWHCDILLIYWYPHLLFIYTQRGWLILECWCVFPLRFVTVVELTFLPSVLSW